MNRVVIGVGSNINPKENIANAKQNIGRHHRIITESKFIETKPLGNLNQPNFLNGVLLIETEMDYEELKNGLIEIEKGLGRKRRKDKYAPRTIDLDIIVWNGKIVDKDVYKRDFLREGVLEVWPEIRI